MSEDGYVDSKYPVRGQTPDPVEDIPEEIVFVRMWRWKELWSAGYDSEVCDILAATSEDLHLMCDAKKAGMTDQEALDIFT